MNPKLFKALQIASFALICITGGSIGGGTLLDDDSSAQLKQEIDQLRQDLEMHIRSKERPGDRWRHHYDTDIRGEMRPDTRPGWE